MLKLNKLSSPFTSDEPLFENISLELHPGECLQVLGENGKGKTTLLRMTAGLLPLETGEIHWGEKSISNCTDYPQARYYLGHKSGVKTNLTISENIDYLCLLNNKHHDNKAQLLKELQLERLAHHRTHHLSAGQQKRLALTQLIHDPAPLWILDEPFSNLDLSAIHWLQDRMINHLKNKGLIIFTSHQKIHLPIAIRELRL